MNTTLKPVSFYLASDDESWDGYADGTKWNGFDNVKVKPEVRDAIVRLLERCWRESGHGLTRDEWVSDIDKLPVGDDGLVDLGWGYCTTIERERPCDCSYLTGRCEKHAAMMRTLREAWESGNERIFELMWSKSDGYGTTGIIPPQGYDWSGIRDSSPESVEAMFEAVKGP